jgi:hypothetical protein
MRQDFIHHLNEDVVLHEAGEKGLAATMGLVLEEICGGRLGCEGQGCQGVHDEIHLEGEREGERSRKVQGDLEYLDSPLENA